ncbi:MAG: phycobilisome linker polypeptide [Cyanobacteria bacterium J06636_16]
MIGQYATSQASSVDSRIFVYEVAGLAQNEVTATHQSPIRSSDNQFIQVPFHRMNEVMRWVTMMGGEIVNIQPLNREDSKTTSSAKA